MNQCNVSYQRKVFQKFDATYELVYQPTFEYLETLLEFSHIVEGSLAWQDAEMFMHYFNMTGEAKTMPKFVFYSAHAETVAPILHAFDSPTLLTPDPASMVLVHYYQNVDGSIDVVIDYVPHMRIKREFIQIADMPLAAF